MSEQRGRALGHALRHRLLFEYLSGPVSPSELARRLAEPLNRVAYHTNVLLTAGYIERVDTERRRGATTHRYRTAVAPEIDGEEWASLPVDLRRGLTLGALRLSMDEARQAALAGGFDEQHAHVTRTPLILDDEGVDAVAALLRSAFVELDSIASRAPSGADVRCQVAMLAYERSPG